MFAPLQDNVLLRLLPREKRTASGGEVAISHEWADQLVLEGCTERHENGQRFVNVEGKEVEVRNLDEPLQPKPYRFVPLQDNVLLRLLPQAKRTASGIELVRLKGPGVKEHREAEVLAVGPGHYPGCRHCGGERGAFQPTAVRVGQTVIVDALCGQNWTGFDVSVPRHNERAEVSAIDGERGEFRIVREAEILCVVEAAQAAE